MDYLKITIKNLKNIKNAIFEFPLENSLNLIVGNNGSGKSTILLALSQSILKNSLKALISDDYNSDSSVAIELGGRKDVWKGSERWFLDNINISLNGMYEGSLFYGTRFNDSRKVDQLLKNGIIKNEDIVDADDYLKEKVSYILHGNNNSYSNLKRIKNRFISNKLGLENTPYFNSINGKLISQYRMSSGECLLISLLHFVYNAIVRRSLPQDRLILILIDEIELALHPIAVSRFIDLMTDLVKKSNNLMIILTSHSPEVIRKIHPKHIYKIENNSGEVNIVTPGFPSYVIRDVYRHDGFDFLILVEDELAQAIVDKVLESNSLRTSKLIQVVPVGGWSNVLSLQNDLLRNNVLGIGKEILSIIDGDVSSSIPKQYDSLKKLFLPIKSVEKFLYDVIILKENTNLRKIINDKYFPIESLDMLESEHNSKFGKTTENLDKKFYYRLRKNLENRGVTEAVFINKLADDIIQHVSFTKFNESLTKIIENCK